MNIERKSLASTSRSLGHRLRVIPVRGYDKALKRVLTLLEDDMALAPALGDSLLSALSELGIQRRLNCR